MGYLTTITILNDAMHILSENRKEFADSIFRGIERTLRSAEAESIGCMNHGNPILVQKARHASDHCLYIHSGNTLTMINGWDYEFQKMCKDNPEYAETIVKQADALLKEAKRTLKAVKEQKKNA